MRIVPAHNFCQLKFSIFLKLTYLSIQTMSLEGHTFVLTGKFSVPKKKLVERIEENGGVVAPSFNKKVSLVKY